MAEEVLRELWILKKLVLGLFLAALVGFEREAKNRPAGLRTHALVGLTATLLTALSSEYAAQFTGEHIRLDPMRTLEALATGVAFIGGGTIFLKRGAATLSGLTTAATLLTVTGIGISVGLGLYVTATATTVLVLAVLRLFKWLEVQLLPPHRRSDAVEDGAGPGAGGEA